MPGTRVFVISVLSCIGIVLANCSRKSEPRVGEGVLRGIVTDSLTGNRLAKASVVLGRGVSRKFQMSLEYEPRVVYDSRVGVATNDSGQFEIKDVVAGRYDVIVSCFEYDSKRMDSVNIMADSTVKIRFELAPSYLRLDRRIHCEGDSGSADTASGLDSVR